MNKPYLRFSLPWAAIHTLFFIGCGWAFAWFAWKQPPAQSSRWQWLDGANASSDGWLFVVIFGGMAVFCAYSALLALWRFWAAGPALIVTRSELQMHASFLRHPRAIPLAEIRTIRLLRGDKHWASGIGGWSARQGQKCRSFLMIEYTKQGGQGRLRLYDNFVEGGVDALKSTYVQLMRIRRSPRVSPAGFARS